MANDGTALGALKEIIGNVGGTSDAQTLVPAIEQLGEVIGSLSDAVGEMQTEAGGVRLKLIAADAMSQAAAQQLGDGATEVPIMSPADLFDADTGTRWFMRDAVMLVFRNGTIIEGARLQFYANLDASNVVPHVYARGHGSTASGILGVDTSWTITANA